jgi:hypothetical protein
MAVAGSRRDFRGHWRDQPLREASALSEASGSVNAKHAKAMRGDGRAPFFNGSAVALVFRVAPGVRTAFAGRRDARLGRYC